MKLNKSEFLKSEFGGELECMITTWDQTLEKNNRTGSSKEVLSTLAWCQAQWEVYRMAIKQFYGVVYHFTRTDEYYGLCTEDESDYLMKVDREQIKCLQYHASTEDMREAMRKTREMRRIAGDYKSSTPDQSGKSAVELVLGRTTEIEKSTLSKDARMAALQKGIAQCGIPENIVIDTGQDKVCSIDK